MKVNSRRLDIDKLENHDIGKTVVNSVKDALQSKQIIFEGNIDEGWKKIRDVLSNVSNKTLGTKKLKLKPWFNRIREEALQIRNVARQNWFNDTRNEELFASVEFVSNLNAMADALDELGDLSEYLQRRNITLVDANKAIRTTIRVFDSMVSEPGHKLAGALKAIELSIYKNVPIHNGKVKQINTSQLHRDQQDNIYNYTNLIDSLSVLDPKKWPTSDNDEVENITFGDDEIRHLCRHFQLNKENDIVRGFQIFKLEGGKEGVPDDLQILFKTVATIPISTSECERNFSSMNEIITPLRSSLNISTVSALLFINCVGPPLTEFHPEKYVRSRLAKGGHSADDNASRKRDKKIDNKYSALWKLL
ncbi:hypothetical protein ACI65C_002977 [Semiaphis heraclei]